MRIIPSHFRWPLALLAIMLSASMLSGCGGGQIAASSWPGLTVDEERAYVAYTSAVLAIDLESGQERWRFPSALDQSKLFYAPPALTAEGQLVVGGFDGVVYILDADNGRLVWSFDEAQGRILGGPIVDEELTYVASADGTLYAINLTSRDLSWSYETESPLWASPTVADGVVYLASLDHKVYALDQESGDLLWSEDISAAIAGAPALADNHLIVGTFGNGLLALDPARGTPIWAFETEGWVWGSPTIDQGTVYFADVTGVVYAVDVETGNELWRLDNLADEITITASPVIDGERLYLSTSEGIFVRLAADGVPLWQEQLEGRMLTRPAISGETLLVASIESGVLLSAFIAESGTLRWSFNPAGE